MAKVGVADLRRPTCVLDVPKLFMICGAQTPNV
jgi:hypothetical protein